MATRSRALALAVAGRRGTAGSRGAALVEFAIILPVMLIILLGIIDLGRVFYTYEALANAAREGARTCAVYNAAADATARTRTRVVGELDGKVTLAATDIALVTCPSGLRGEPITVNVGTDFSLVTPLMQEIATGVVGGVMRLQASAQMVVW